MAETPDTHEVLVHIAAASTAQDEARYRAQVAAILEFQCVTRQPVMQTQSNPEGDPHTHLFSADPGVHLHSSTRHEASPILREASRPAFPASDHRSLPGTDSAGPRQQIIANHPDSLESLISVIPDSQPEIAALVNASSSHAELSSFVQHDPPAKRPRTAPTSPDQPESNRELQLPSAAAQPAATHTVNPIQTQICNSGFPSNPISISSSDPESSPDSNHPPPNAINLTSLPLQILPPKPPISAALFTTHITPTLSMLTERLKPVRTYKPSHQARPLDPLERGYWLVRFAIEAPDQNIRDSADRPNQTSEETHLWPATLFRAFWSFLQDFIGKDGRAGWGVWCILEPAPLQSSHATHVTLKVYTWGEVVMHVYLLLFLASERRVRGMGAQWRDSREEVVIQMP